MARHNAGRLVNREETQRHISNIARKRSAVNQAEDALYRAVEDAREAGMSWQAIGDVLGVSRQAAQQRFGAWVD